MPGKPAAESIRDVQRELDMLKGELAVLRDRLDSADLKAVLKLVTQLDERVAELKRTKEEADRRTWNLLMIGLGAVLSLLGGVVVQLISFAIRK